MILPTESAAAAISSPPAAAFRDGTMPMFGAIPSIPIIFLSLELQSGNPKMAAPHGLMPEEPMPINMLQHLQKQDPIWYMSVQTAASAFRQTGVVRIRFWTTVLLLPSPTE